MLRRRGKVAEDNVVSEESFPQQDHDDKHTGLGKSNIHPEQSNIMLRNQKTTTFEVKDIEE